MLLTSLSKHSVLIPRGQSVSSVTGGVEYFREDRQHTWHNLVPREIVCCLSSRKQLESPWNLLQCAQNIFDTDMSELICIIGRISTSIDDKQQSKVADLAKYVHLPEVGTFQVSISVTKS